MRDAVVILLTILQVRIYDGMWAWWKSRRRKKPKFPYRWVCPMEHCGLSFSTNTELALKAIKLQHLDNHDKRVILQRRGYSQVLLAWTEEGTHPIFHQKKQAELRRDWPILAEALDQLAGEN